MADTVSSSLAEGHAMTAPTKAALRSDEKAAIVLFSLGRERAERLFRQMDGAEHRLLAHAFNRLGEVSVEQITEILHEFTAALQRGRPLQGGAAETREFLLKFLEPASVEQVMADIGGVAGSDVWQRLSDLPEQRLATYLSREKPQTMAVILSRLRPDKAAATLMQMPAEMAREIVLRLAHLRQVDREVIEELQSSVMQDFLARAGEDEAAGQTRGVIASMLSEMPAEQAESFMEFLQSESPEVAEAVQKSMFRFHDIPTKVTPAALQLVIRNCDKETLILALRLAAQKAPQLADYFMQNMSKRAAEQLKEDMEGAGPVRVKDAQKAQAQIIRLIQELARKGEIVLAGKGDDDTLIE
jgi:flagellar motor switch protein FliG